MKEILKESVPVDLDNIISFDSLSNEVFAEFANVEQVTGVKVSRSFGSESFYISLISREGLNRHDKHSEAVLLYFLLAKSVEMGRVYFQWRRFAQMNNLLRGLRPGELTLFSGTTGCGKTTFLGEYSIDLCMQGVGTVIQVFVNKSSSVKNAIES